MWATVLDFGIFKSSPEGTLSHSPGRSEAEAWVPKYDSESCKDGIFAIQAKMSSLQDSYILLFVPGLRFASTWAVG